MTHELPPTVAVLDRANKDLANVNPSPFTSGAFRALTEIIDEFIGDLVDESYRIARRRKSEDVVSINDVQQAGEHLISTRPRRLFRHMGTVGGSLFGVSLSNILAMAQTGDSFPILGTLVSIGIGLVGTFLMAIHMAKD